MKLVLRLADTRAFSSGVVVHTYRPVSRSEAGWPIDDSSNGFGMFVDDG